MKFDEANREAADWISKNDSQLSVSASEDDRSQNKLQFQVPDHQDISFYVVIADEEKQTKWLLWSDVDDVLRKLQPTIEEVTNGRFQSVSDILASCQLNLFSSSGAEQGKQKEDNNDEEEDAEDDEEDDEGDDDYYGDSEDFMDDVRETVNTGQGDDSDVDLDDDEGFFGTMNAATSAAVHRLGKDLKNIVKVGPEYGIIAKPRGNNLFLWDVKLTDVPTDCRLGKDLSQYSTKYNQEPVLNLEMQFPPEYPFSPPFIRVIKPRFKFLTGHVTIGGSICMQMLTKSGWVPANDIESILISVRSEIMSDSNASLDMSRPNVPYTEQEARDAFNRMVQRYNWNK